MTGDLVSVQEAGAGALPAGHPLLGFVLMAIGVSTLLEHGIDQLPALVTAGAAFLGGLAALLPTLSKFLDRRQARRHSEERHRRQVR